MLLKYTKKLTKYFDLDNGSRKKQIMIKIYL